MIAALTGIVRDRDDHSITLDVHGVSFAIRTTPPTSQRAVIGETLTLLTHLHVREDALELFGFIDRNERQMFERLLSVSGVGPKVALTLLGALSFEVLTSAIEKGNAAILRSVPGVGSKNAERSIVDLRGKLLITADQQGDDEIVSALIRLGYSSKEAREVARQVPTDSDAEQRLRAALQLLGK